MNLDIGRSVQEGRQGLVDESFGHRLRVLLADRGMSPSELASKSGLSRQMVNNYLNSGSIPGLENACAIAKALGLTVDDLALTSLKKLVTG